MCLQAWVLGGLGTWVLGGLGAWLLGCLVNWWHVYFDEKVFNPTVGSYAQCPLL